MSKIKYISREAIKDLIVSEVQSNKSKGNILSSKGFAQHLIDTGDIGHQVATKILEKHPTLKGQVNPEIVRLAGWIHDFSKIYEGNRYHDIGTPYLVITQGDKNLGLIIGGSTTERSLMLKEVARLIPPDYALYDELGGPNFPQSALYTDQLDNFLERLNMLRRDLSKTEEILSLEQLTLPLTLNQKIACYADMVNVNGETINPQERLIEIQERYGDSKSEYYDPKMEEVTRVITPRILTVCSTIESLM